MKQTRAGPSRKGTARRGLAEEGPHRSGTLHGPELEDKVLKSPCNQETTLLPRLMGSTAMAGPGKGTGPLLLVTQGLL